MKTENTEAQGAVHVGFWRDTKSVPKDHVGDVLPWPNAQNNPWKGQREFVEKLTRVELAQPEKTTAYYKGLSLCRICECANGSKEYTFNGFCWPEGFAHYVAKHNVQPPQEFIDMILAAEVP